MLVLKNHLAIKGAIIALTFLISCNKNIAGEYYNDYEKNAEHKIILHTNKTYLYFYENNGVKDSVIGKWESYEGIVFFTDFIGLGKFNKIIYSDTANVLVPLDNGTLKFSEDLPAEANFFKK